MTNLVADKTLKELNKVFDKKYAHILIENVISLISELYFRAEFKGFDSLPRRSKNGSPLIFISNHSGMAFSWDSIVFTSSILKQSEYDFSFAPRVMADPMLNVKRLMSPFLINNFWRKMGAVDASFRNFDAMMKLNETNLIIYPEGNLGLSKGFDKKYQLQKFSDTYLMMSLRHRADIVIYYTINAEYNNPNSFKSDTVNKWVQKIGMPFLPMGLSTILLFLQPWLYYFSFPSKLRYVFGEVISPYEMLDKDPKLVTKSDLNKLNTIIKEKMQEKLDTLVKTHGKSPYQFSELFKTFGKNTKKAFSILPFLWGFRMAEHDRLYAKSPELTSKMKDGKWILPSVFMNLGKLIFFIPILGWIPVLILGLKDQKR